MFWAKLKPNSQSLKINSARIVPKKLKDLCTHKVHRLIMAWALRS